jgi:ribosomal protein S17E
MSVTNEHILAGFANLHQVITTGFDTVRREMAELRTELRTEFRNEIAGLEHRMMRRFDQIEERLDNHEGRIGALEARESS